MRRRLTSALILACGLLAAPAAASAQDAPATGPVEETASSGSVAATLDYTRVNEYEAKDVRLTVTRAGVPALTNADISGACRACRGALPLGGVGGLDAKSVTLRDLTGDGDPEVLVDLYTGGAHCCSILVLFGWDPATSTYRRLVRNFGDPSYRVARLNGATGLDLLTADDRFAYAFCAYACSAMPDVVLRYEGFGLVDVTRRFPDRIRRQIRELRASLRSARRGPKDDRFVIKGVLPALCADLYLLRRGAECRGELARARRGGELAGSSLDIGPSGRKYVRDVLAFLKKTGYR